MTNTRPHGLETTLPSAWYTRPEFFAAEKEHLFYREWTCVGREEELPGPGDHRIIDLAGQSLLLVRNADGQLRAFYNVCRHRGARLCGEAVTAAGAPVLNGGVVGRRSIICPYHAWTYDLDGQLIHAPHMKSIDDFDAKEIRLHAVGIDTWGGFVFVNLAAHGTPPGTEVVNFATVIDGIRQRMVRYPLATLRTAKILRYRVAANWKVLCENYNECYHCGPVHPELCSLVPAFREGGGNQLDWERGIPHRSGADTFTASGRSTRPSFAGLNADELVRHKGELVYPNLFLSLAREHVAAFILEPKAPDVTLISCVFLFDAAQMAKPGFDPSDVVEFWDLVNRQDWAICEAVQQGMNTRIHDCGLISPMEDWTLDIRRYVTERVGRFV